MKDVEANAQQRDDCFTFSNTTILAVSFSLLARAAALAPPATPPTTMRRLDTSLAAGVSMGGMMVCFQLRVQLSFLTCTWCTFGELLSLLAVSALYVSACGWCLSLLRVLFSSFFPANLIKILPLVCDPRWSRCADFT